jgi:hypothetical protein
MRFNSQEELDAAMEKSYEMLKNKFDIMLAIKIDEYVELFVRPLDLLTPEERHFNESHFKYPNVRYCFYCHNHDGHKDGCPAGKTKPYRYM